MATHPIWQSISSEFAHEILLGVHESNRKLYRMALELLAPHQGLRVVRVLDQPKRERHAAWQTILSHPGMEQLSFNLFSAWLLATQKELLCHWLDALEIPHDGQGCADGFPPSPTEERLRSALEQILSKHRTEVVAVYLRVFNEIEDVRWAPLQQIISTEPALQWTAKSGESDQADAADLTKKV